MLCEEFGFYMLVYVAYGTYTKSYGTWINGQTYRWMNGILIWKFSVMNYTVSVNSYRGL